MLRANTVADKAGERHVMSGQTFVGGDNFGGSSVLNAGAGQIDGVVFSTTLDVESAAPAREGDSFAWAAPIGDSFAWAAPIQLLKMDIEGFEPKALSGALGLVKTGRIKYIVTECTIYDEAKLAAYWAVYAQIIDAGYDMFSLGLKENGALSADRLTLGALKASAPLARSAVQAFLRAHVLKLKPHQLNFVFARATTPGQVVGVRTSPTNHGPLRGARGPG